MVLATLLTTLPFLETLLVSSQAAICRPQMGDAFHNVPFIAEH